MLAGKRRRGLHPRAFNVSGKPRKDGLQIFGKSCDYAGCG